MQFDSPCPWLALQVRTRSEILVQDALRRKSFETFLPTYKELRHYPGRVRKVDAALFPGYLFCRVDPEETLAVLTTPGVFDVVRAGEKLLPIEDEELAAIRHLLASNSEVTPWAYLKAGEQVYVYRGPLTGIEGVLVSEKGHDRLVLSISLLQRSVSVEVDRTCVRPVKDRNLPNIISGVSLQDNERLAEHEPGNRNI